MIDEAASSERELRDFLASLVRLLKPQVVVETGCYLGRATEAIAKALCDNRSGFLYTCDTVESYAIGVATELVAFPVAVRHCAGVDLPELRVADLVFLDSDYGHRRAEFDLVKPGALVVVHDTRISYDSAIPPHETWVRPLGGVLFETYRGFALIRKAE